MTASPDNAINNKASTSSDGRHGRNESSPPHSRRRDERRGDRSPPRNKRPRSKDDGPPVEAPARQTRNERRLEEEQSAAPAKDVLDPTPIGVDVQRDGKIVIRRGDDLKISVRGSGGDDHRSDEDRLSRGERFERDPLARRSDDRQGSGDDMIPRQRTVGGSDGGLSGRDSSGDRRAPDEVVAARRGGTRDLTPSSGHGGARRIDNPARMLETAVRRSVHQGSGRDSSRWEGNGAEEHRKRPTSAANLAPADRPVKRPAPPIQEAAAGMVIVIYLYIVAVDLLSMFF